MGVFCPECNTHQAIVQNITVDGNPARKSADVVARKLACGHVIGGEKYNDFVQRVHEIDTEAAGKIAEISNDAYSKKSALWKAMGEKGKVI